MSDRQEFVQRIKEDGELKEFLLGLRELTLRTGISIAAAVVVAPLFGSKKAQILYLKDTE